MSKLDTANLKYIWWLVQLNAVFWFLSIGLILEPSSSLKSILPMFLGLFIAAVLEFIVYRNIYVKFLKKGIGTENH